MKIKKLIVLFTTIVFVYGFANAQDSLNSDKLKRSSIGIAIGSPDLITIHGNYILPVLNNHIATGFTGGWFTFNKCGVYLWGINIDYYFNKKGKGFFAGTEFERNITKIQNQSELTSDGVNYSINFKYFYRYYNLYLGYACTWKRTYFIPEIGLNYTHADNYVIETVFSNTNSNTFIEPLRNGQDLNSLIPLIRLSFGFRF